MLKKKTRKKSIINVIGTQKFVVLMVLVFLLVLFSVMSQSFRNYTTLITLFSHSYYITFMAIGVTFVIISGGVDLSLGAGMICYSLIGGFLIMKGVPVLIAMLVTVITGFVFGLLNGYLVAVLKIPPFIATLGTMMVCRGIGSIISGGMSITWPMMGSDQGWFRSIFRVQIGGIIFPIGFVLVVLFVIVMTYVLNHTKTGRYIISIGSNTEATRLSGVQIEQYHMSAYAISGLFTGIAAIAYAATFQAIMPGTGGGLELDAIASSVIGGASMSGGVGSVSGTLIGVFIMALLKTGLPYIGLQANWQQIISGIVLALAVGMDVYRNKRIFQQK